MPFNSSPSPTQWKTAAVSSVTTFSKESEPVYDLQVENCHNFFAGGILVHNCGIIDDPIKSDEEALSKTVRERQKEWYRSTFYTRAEPNAAIIIIQTRWHEDDLSGWLLSEEDRERPEGWTIVNLPAIAEEHPPEFPKSCTVIPDWRQPGEPLCKERFDLPDLEVKKATLGAYWFGAEFQQRPTSRLGDFFKVNKLRIIPRSEVPENLVLCRAWDMGASKERGDYTVGILMGLDNDRGMVYILDMLRGQWGPEEVEQAVLNAAVLDGPDVKIHLAQDPGQAGKFQIAHFVKKLMGYSVFHDRADKKKELRARPFAAQVNAGSPDEPGNVYIAIGGQGKYDLVEELRAFPFGSNDDAVDACADAFTSLALGGEPITSEPTETANPMTQEERRPDLILVNGEMRIQPDRIDRRRLRSGIYGY